MKKALELGVAVLAVVGLILPLFNRAWIENAFYQYSYYIMTAIVVAWMVSFGVFLRYIRQIPLKRAMGIFFLTSLVGVAIMVATNSLEMKINSDEACLLSTANGFYLSKMPYNTTEAKFYFDGFYPINQEVPVRPLLFPYLVQIVHRIIGMSETSMYVVNLLLSFLSLFLVQLLFFIESESILSSIAGGLFLFSLPLFQMFATTGGFDFASSFFLFLSMWVGVLTLRNPNDRMISFFILTLTLFSHVRYEGPLIAAALGLFVLLNVPQKLKFIFRWESYLLVGSLCLHVWQRILTADALQSPPGKSVFSIENLIDNTKTLVSSIFVIDLPFNPVFTLLSVPVAAIAVFHPRFVKYRKTAWFLILGIGFSTLFTLSSLSGIYNTPTNTRYFFPLAMGGLILIPLLALIHFKPRPGLMLAFAFANWAAFGLDASHYAFLNTLTLVRDVRYINHFVKEQHTKRMLIVYDRPVQITALGYGAMTLKRAQDEFKSISQELHNGLYDHVYIFEESTYATEKQRWTADEKLFKPVTFYQQFSNHVMYVSELR